MFLIGLFWCCRVQVTPNQRNCPASQRATSSVTRDFLGEFQMPMGENFVYDVCLILAYASVLITTKITGLNVNWKCIARLKDSRNLSPMYWTLKFYAARPVKTQNFTSRGICQIITGFARQWILQFLKVNYPKRHKVHQFLTCVQSRSLNICSQRVSSVLISSLRKVVCYIEKSW